MANELAGKYDGCVLICGSAPCLFADYQAALKARPHASVMAINDAASVIFADFLATLHPDKAHLFRCASKNPDILTISGQHRGEAGEINFWFDGCNSGATTAGAAIKMAKAMGFNEIILCGCPMTGGDGYFDAPAKANKFGMPLRFGNAPRSSTVVTRHQKHMMFEAGNSDYSMVKSMSGWTADFLGTPNFVRSKAA